MQNQELEDKLMTTPDSGEDAAALEEAMSGQAELLSVEPSPEVFRERDYQAVEQQEEPPGEEPREEAATSPLTQKQLERRAFFGANFSALDRSLSPEQRQEWMDLYASYRGGSVLRGMVVGVDPMTLGVVSRTTGKYRKVTTLCVAINSLCARIVIPTREIWYPKEGRPDNVTRNLYGAMVDYVVTNLDREGCFVVGSRRKAMAARRRYFASQPSLHTPGARVNCDILVTAPHQATVTCYGYDILLGRQNLTWPFLPDLRTKFRDKTKSVPCIVKEYDREGQRLRVSIKEAAPNPFDGAEIRHPLGSHRQGQIVFKYKGGVFVALPDDVTVMCNYSFQYQDGDFEELDRVIVAISQYNYDKKEIYGRIIAKF